MQNAACGLFLAFALLLASSAQAGDDQLVYSDMLNNGWGNWGYNATLVFTNTTPVHSGSNSIKATMPAWSRIWLVHDPIDTSLYTNLSFWINGWTNGGQRLQVAASLDGIEQTWTNLPPLPTNFWQQITIPLAALGVADKTNLNYVWINNWSSSAQPTLYLDDIRLIAKPPPAIVHVSVNATQTVRTVDARLFGINTAAWDGYLDTPGTLAILNEMDNQALRWPGGSWADEYHWTNEYRGWGSYTTNFAHVATNTRAQVYMIANYGSGTPQEAAGWVRFCNVTNQYGFKYWEIGNEVGGSWETDNNTNAPWLPHDPWTYAMRFKDYYNQMKAADPTIKIGAVADITEDGTANYTNHPVVNPRTGVTHYGWTPVMLHTMLTNGVIPDFLIEHKYAPNSGDTFNLLYPKTWAADAANLRQMLTDYLGSQGTNVELVCTEHGAGGDRQRVSLVGGLFYADSLGQILQTEFNAQLWWDLRNGQSPIYNSDSALYGWRTGWFTNVDLLTNTLEFYNDGGIVAPADEPTNRYPVFYCAKLMKYFARGGDLVVNVGSDYQLLSAYAACRTNGALTILAVNKSSQASLPAAIAIQGYQPAPGAVAFSFGIPQDEAARTGVGSLDLDQTNVAGIATSFELTFPPYSATVLSLAPLPSLAILPSAQSPGGAVVLELGGQPGARYVLQSSTNLTTWVADSTNMMTTGTLRITNTIPAGATMMFWRAAWLP